MHLTEHLDYIKRDFSKYKPGSPVLDQITSTDASIVIIILTIVICIVYVLPDSAPGSVKVMQMGQMSV